MNSKTIATVGGVNLTVCLTCGIFMLCVLAVLIVLIRSNYKHQKELIRLGKYSSNIQATIDNTIPDLMSFFIKDCFDDYIIMEFGPRQELYINEDLEKEIREKLVDIVVDRLSPNMMDKLSLFYNPINFDRIIADKVYITVMNFVVAHNAMISGEVESHDVRQVATPQSADRTMQTIQ